MLERARTRSPADDGLQKCTHPRVFLADASAWRQEKQSNMKNSTLMGALVIAIALVPSFASASTFTPYAELIGQKHTYTALGVQSVMPTLSQAHGTAQINNPQFVGTAWVLEVECLASSPVNCDGNIVT